MTSTARRCVVVTWCRWVLIVVVKARWTDRALKRCTGREVAHAATHTHSARIRIIVILASRTRAACRHTNVRIVPCTARCALYGAVRGSLDAFCSCHYGQLFCVVVWQSCWVHNTGLTWFERKRMLFETVQSWRAALPKRASVWCWQSKPDIGQLRRKAV